MLDYTKAALRETWTAFKKTIYVCSVVIQAVYIAYLIYALIAQTGFLVANVILLALSLVYFVFFLMITKGGRDPEAEKFKEVKRHGSTVYKWSKRAVTLVTLGLTVYGLFTAVKNTTPLSIIFTALMIVGWLLSTIFDILSMIVASYGKLIFEGFEADLDNMKKPVTTVTNFFKRVTGQEVEPAKEPTKRQLRLKEKVEAYQAEKAQQKRDKKERRKQDKLNKKQQAKEQKRSEKVELALIKKADKAQKHAKRNIKQLPAPTDEEIAATEEQN
ncbi:MAG: hypothetical protein IJY62_04985 [Clostridia bacterium]|nr:hypothetical protein [Clostridia bacterium]